ncbi:MAG TPA: Na+/H+ antiporter subunit E [Xanthobacteraceae bacterium]|nr:Na+/H+ antiporter subunit E [Xanthobacteraceae bacterium]
MTRWIRFPLVSVALLILWLLLNQTVSAGHILLGSLIAIIGGWSLTLLELPIARMRRPTAMIRLSALVLADIVRSNIAVARIVLGDDRGRERKSGFIDIPLELRDPYGLAALACIITSTPGTLWANFDASSGTLTIHVLDLIDESEWIRTIKSRYERLLLEIFA